MGDGVFAGSVFGKCRRGCAKKMSLPMFFCFAVSDEVVTWAGACQSGPVITGSTPLYCGYGHYGRWEATAARSSPHGGAGVVNGERSSFVDLCSGRK